MRTSLAHARPAAGTPLTSFERRLAANLQRVDAHIHARLLRFFRPHGLTPHQFAALCSVAAASPGQSVPSGRVGRDLTSCVPDVTRVLDRLEGQALILRTRSRSDRRVVQVWLTETGREIFDRLDPLVSEHHRQLFAGMGQREVLDLDRLLARALRCLEGLSSTG